MKKRMFQILDEMNLHDIAQGTEWVQVGNNIAACDGKKDSDLITFRIPKGLGMKAVMEPGTVAIVIVLDNEQYLRIRNEGGAE